MRQQGGRRSAESGGSNVFSPQLARKSYLREESSMTKNSERAIDAKLTRRAFVGAAAATAPSIYAQQGKCRNHAAFSTLKTIKQPL